MSQPQKPKLNVRQVGALRKIDWWHRNSTLLYVYVNNDTGASLEGLGLVVSRPNLPGDFFFYCTTKPDVII